MAVFHGKLLDGNTMIKEFLVAAYFDVPYLNHSILYPSFLQDDAGKSN